MNEGYQHKADVHEQEPRTEFTRANHLPFFLLGWIGPRPCKRREVLGEPDEECD